MLRFVQASPVDPRCPILRLPFHRQCERLEGHLQAATTISRKLLGPGNELMQDGWTLRACTEFVQTGSPLSNRGAFVLTFSRSSSVSSFRTLSSSK